MSSEAAQNDTLAVDLSATSEPVSSPSSSIQAEDFAQVPPASSVPQAPRFPAIRMASASTVSPSMTASSTPLGNLSAARRPGPAALDSDIQAKMRNFHLSRRGPPSAGNLLLPPNPMAHANSASQVPLVTGPMVANTMAPAVGGPFAGGVAGLRLPPNVRPSVQSQNSAPAIPTPSMGAKGLAARRGPKGGLKLSDATGSAVPTLSLGNTALPGANTTEPITNGAGQAESAFKKYEKYVDTKTGALKFNGEMTIHGGGIDFSSGSSFNISLDEVDTMDELGKGNYGTVYKVRHSRPRVRRPGQGLAGNRAPPSLSTTAAVSSLSNSSPAENFENPMSPKMSAVGAPRGNTTGVIMAMKEIRLELDDAKFAAIIMELKILHRCVSPFIVDFYGAFFQEGAVYICMEFMDGGSIDKLYGDGIPENVLRKITLSTVMGLKSLKDDHSIIHRDVKPTNILINSRGQVKICDFGVSGNLVASIAKTNIGCQSYMAPERISSGGMAQAGANPGGGTYSVQSDIWSLGLSIIECALGQYPYPPETYNNIFSQLSVILNLSVHNSLANQY